MTLDDQLASLAAEPGPAALDRLDADVLARIALLPKTRMGRNIGTVVALGALGLGLAGSYPPDTRVRAGISALGSDQPFAPSTLLASVE